MVDDFSPERQWPLYGIRLTYGDVSLRPVRETDLDLLARLLPDDAEHDPSSEMLEGLSLEENRRRILLQSYWRSWGTWSVDSWCIYFLVSHRDRVVGVQTLEADHFRSLRTVDSSSWLRRDARRIGIGIAMRTAVLSLAFDSLGAETAITAARQDNQASLGVSSHLGYEGNGVSTSLSPSGPCTLQHMILRRSTWVRAALGEGVAVTGVAACAPWFGVDIAEERSSARKPATRAGLS